MGHPLTLEVGLHFYVVSAPKKKKVFKFNMDKVTPTCPAPANTLVWSVSSNLLLSQEV